MPAPDRRVDMAVALTGGTPSDVRDVLDRTAVVVALDPSDGAAAVLAAAALVAMSARVAGHVIVGPVPLPHPNPWGTRTLPGVAAASRLDRPVDGALTSRRITVRVGGERPDGRQPARPRLPHRVRSADIYVGGDDWTAVVSRRGPVAVGPCPLGGLGLQIAAALAVGEILKELLGPVGMRCVPVEDELVWNLVDGQLGPAPALDAEVDPEAPRRSPLPVPIALLGAGSIGSSAAAVLAFTGLSGVVDVVDPDHFDPARNAYRCPGVPAGERGAKATWAAKMLRAAGWRARPYVGHITEWSTGRPDPGFPGLALVSVDNVDGRRDAGDLMAATTVSAGVSGAALHVHRHRAIDELACPYCEFVDARRWREQAEVYARLGLTVNRLQALLGGAKLTVEDIATAIWTGAVDSRAVHDLPGRCLVDLIARHYATVAVRFGNDAVAQPVSAPHVPWLAGTLLAAEVVKAAVGLPGLDRRVELDLSGLPLGGWRRPPRDPSGRCPCTSPPRRDVARTLYDP